MSKPDPTPNWWTGRVLATGFNSETLSQYLGSVPNLTDICEMNIHCLPPLYPSFITQPFWTNHTHILCPGLVSLWTCVGHRSFLCRPVQHWCLGSSPFFPAAHTALYTHILYLVLPWGLPCPLSLPVSAGRSQAHRHRAQFDYILIQSTKAEGGTLIFETRNNTYWAYRNMSDSCDKVKTREEKSYLSLNMFAVYF